jgi:hypothetical protein
MAEKGRQNPENHGPDPSVEGLARRLMDLWQEQMAAIAADPDLMRQMGLMMSASPLPAMMQGILQGMLAGAPQAGVSPVDTAPGAKPGAAPNPGPNPFEWWKSDGSQTRLQGDRPQDGEPAGGASRPTAAAAASRPGGGELAELRRRLAGLETRLQELGEAGKRIAAESEPGLPPGKPASAGKPRAARKSPGKVGGAPRRGGRGGSGGTGNGAAG